MFQGETAITIDDKGRLAIPTAYREKVARACGNRLVIVYNPYEAGCLWIYPHERWEKLKGQVNALNLQLARNRTLQRKLVGAAALVELDGNGRISLPASHRATTGIERRAVLLGVGEKFELWSEAAHQAQNQQTLGDDDNLQELTL